MALAPGILGSVCGRDVAPVAGLVALGVWRGLIGHYERVQRPRWLCTKCPVFTARNHRGFIAMNSNVREAAKVRWVNKRKQESS